MNVTVPIWPCTSAQSKGHKSMNERVWCERTRLAYRESWAQTDGIHLGWISIISIWPQLTWKLLSRYPLLQQNGKPRTNLNSVLRCQDLEIRFRAVKCYLHAKCSKTINNKKKTENQTEMKKDEWDKMKEKIKEGKKEEPERTRKRKMMGRIRTGEYERWKRTEKASGEKLKRGIGTREKVEKKNDQRRSEKTAELVDGRVFC